eukprot:jgi/Chrzof1/13421/Cz07g32120.t1
MYCIHGVCAGTGQGTAAGRIVNRPSRALQQQQSAASFCSKGAGSPAILTCLDPSSAPFTTLTPSQECAAVGQKLKLNVVSVLGDSPWRGWRYSATGQLDPASTSTADIGVSYPAGLEQGVLPSWRAKSTVSMVIVRATAQGDACAAVYQDSTTSDADLQLKHTTAQGDAQVTFCHLQQPSGYCKRPEALCNYNDGSAALGHSQQPLQSSSACLDIIGQSVYIPNNTCDDSAMRVDQAGMSARYGTMSEIKVHYAPVQRSSPGNAAKEASTPTATGITTCIVGLEPVYGSQTNRCGALMGFAALNLAGTEQGGTKSLLLTPTQRITKITAKGSGCIEHISFFTNQNSVLEAGNPSSAAAEQEFTPGNPVGFLSAIRGFERRLGACVRPKFMLQACPPLVQLQFVWAVDKCAKQGGGTP